MTKIQMFKITRQEQETGIWILKEKSRFTLLNCAMKGAGKISGWKSF